VVFIVAGHCGFLPFYFFIYQQASFSVFNLRSLNTALLRGCTLASCIVLLCLHSFWPALSLVPLLILSFLERVSVHVVPWVLGRPGPRSGSKGSSPARRELRIVEVEGSHGIVSLQSPGETMLPLNGEADSPRGKNGHHSGRRRRCIVVLETAVACACAIAIVCLGVALSYHRKHEQIRDSREGVGLIGNGGDSQATARFAVLVAQEVVCILALMFLLPRLVMLWEREKAARNRASHHSDPESEAKPRRGLLRLLLLGASPHHETGNQQQKVRNADREGGEKGGSEQARHVEKEDGCEDVDVEMDLIGRYEVRRTKENTYDFR
ncbi:hypothetical protein CSUI_011015, partial [Cystoisospora suis]